MIHGIRPLYIFDIDGTIADCTHRRYLIEGEKQDWPSFYRSCVNDMPIHATIRTLKHLYRSGADIYFFTGRSDDVRQETEDWLNAFLGDVNSAFVWMRAESDHTPDDKLKEEWYRTNLGQYDRDRLVAVFEDRKRVVDMWRRNGVMCYQVAEGDF